MFCIRKNSKLFYYLSAYFWAYLPYFLSRVVRWWTLRGWEQREDADYIRRRVNYYCKTDKNDEAFTSEAFYEQSIPISSLHKTHPSVYFLDAMRYLRSFSPKKRVILLSGDIIHNVPLPSLVKSRLLNSENISNVLLKLDKVRHFLFINDPIPFSQKKDEVLFRGLIGQAGNAGVKKNRYAFVRKFFGKKGFNVGVLDEHFPQWQVESLSLKGHLDYKYIMALEGNDVATNLKWVMSSSCVAVMPRLTCETWFMEGRLIPNYHYIEVKADFSDLEERIAYYNENPQEAEAIVRNANLWVSQFKNNKRERIISYLVCEKYLRFS